NCIRVPRAESCMSFTARAEASPTELRCRALSGAWRSGIPSWEELCGGDGESLTRVPALETNFSGQQCRSTRHEHRDIWSQPGLDPSEWGGGVLPRAGSRVG